VVGNKNSIALLSAAAASLTALSSNGAEIATDYQLGVRHHSYEEDGLPASLGGSQDRYDIDVNQFSLVAPLTEDMDVSLTYQHENMSGASPWYTIQDSEGNAIQIMSGASIEDTRTDMSAKLRMKNGSDTYGIVLATSDEDDYDSQAIGVDFSREAADKLSSWSIAFDVSNDDVSAVDADIFTTRPATQESKRSNSLFASYTQIISKNSLVQLGLGYSHKSGFLSDPYKMVLVPTGLISDTRPDSRNAKTLSARYRYFVDAADAAMHVDYRFYDDSWSVRSHTIEMAWHQNLPAGFQLIPNLRAYSQTAAYFYESFYSESRSDGFYSTDYRLSEYGAITTGVKLLKSFDSWSLTASYQQYASGGSTFLASETNENPALLDFKFVTVGFNVSF
jgi:hypothetical protein